MWLIITGILVPWEYSKVARDTCERRIAGGCDSTRKCPKQFSNPDKGICTSQSSFDQVLDVAACVAGRMRVRGPTADNIQPTALP